MSFDPPVVNIDAKDILVAKGMPAADESARASVEGAKPFTPKPILGISVQPMAPVAAAGVNLAKIVLGITFVSIMLLTAYLFLMDWTAGTDIRDVYKQMLNPNRIGTEFQTLGRLERLLVDLGDAAAKPDSDLSPEAAENAGKVVKLVYGLRSLTAAQRTAMERCLPLPKGADRAALIASCANVIETVRQAAMETATGAADAQIVADFATRINEQHQSLRTFWLQAAQLILLNLLLPLLTALFGYVFGTQQARQQQ